MLVFSFIICTLFVLRVSSEDPKPNPDWWKHAVFYQVYPRSFKDDDNDGIGDLEGIMSKMDHFKDAGITGIWLSPIYKSPQIDQGYDISSYMDIDQDYGTMDDFQKLVERAHKLGIKVIMDFVPNHTSDHNEWFRKSCMNNETHYHEYYVWKEGKTGNQPPNNWVSVFRGPAWKYHSGRNMWYLHQFTEQQPDLNFRNPDVIDEIEKMFTFWLDKGVDGFRMDATPYLIEDADFPDEPVLCNDNDYNCLNHIYTFDQPESFEVVYKFRTFLDKYSKSHPDRDPVIMMSEAYSNLTNTIKWYGDGEKLGSHFSFNFFLLGDVRDNDYGEKIAKVVNRWMDAMPENYTANWVLGNHDNPRVATRFGKENVDGFNMITLLLPGIGVTYNGEEIGQEDGDLTFEEGQDPKACKESPSDFRINSRDHERTPFHWDDSINAGFNTGFPPWLPVSPKYLTNNLADQKKSKKSYFNTYKNLTKLRQEPQFAEGGLFITNLTKDVVAFSRDLKGKDTFYVIFNTGTQNATVNLDAFKGISDNLEVVLSGSTSTREEGDTIPSKNLYLDPHESIVAKESANSRASPANRNVLFGLLVWFSMFILFKTMN